jgi:hypothetical protein
LGIEALPQRKSLQFTRTRQTVRSTMNARAMGQMGAATQAVRKMVQLPGKLFGLAVDVDQASAAELQAALEKLQVERSEAIAKISTLTTERTNALLVSDDRAVEAVEKILDATHRAAERLDLLADSLGPRIEVGRAREAEAADKAQRQQTAEQLTQLALDVERNYDKLATALAKFATAVKIVERTGEGVAGNLGMVSHVVALVKAGPEIASTLRSRAAKVVAGSGPPVFEGLD